MTAKKLAWLVSVLALSVTTVARGQTLPIVPNVEPQPFIAQTMRLIEALEFLGSELPEADARRLEQLRDEAPTQAVVEEIQRILDQYVLAMVQINPEARVSVVRGPAPAELVQGGWKAVLVKVHNAGSVRGRLEVESPNAEPVLHRSTYLAARKRRDRDHARPAGESVPGARHVSASADATAAVRPSARIRHPAAQFHGGRSA